jgi:uncharacterized protein YxeA
LMMKKLLVHLMILILAIGHAIPVFAAEEQPSIITLNPTDDSYTEDGSSTLKGSDSNLQTHSLTGSTPRKIYLKFDFSSADLTEIGTATIRLYSETAYSNRILTAKKAVGNDTTWSEGSILWDNAPQEPAIEAEISSTDISGIADQYVELNVTSYLQEIVEDGQVTIVVTGTGYNKFTSKEGAEGQRPQLVITTTDSNSEETNAQITPTAAVFDKGNPENIDVTVVSNGKTLNSITNNSQTLVETQDYTVTDSVYSINASYLTNLVVGTHTLTFDFDAGTDPSLEIYVIDSTNDSDEITLIPMDDSFIEGQTGRTANINGLSADLQIANDGHSNPRKIYMKFDFNGVDLTDITTAVVRLYNTDTRYSRTITANKTSGLNTDNAAWTEENLTWDNAPAAGEAILNEDGSPASFTTVKVADSSAVGDDRLEGAAYYDLDISTYFGEVSEDGQLSIMLQSTGYTVFAGKEHKSGQYAPQLVLSSDKIIVDASDDSFIEGQSDRTTNINGLRTDLQITNGGHSNPREIYLKFDFNSVDLTDITTAVIRLYNTDTRYSRTITANKTSGDNTSWAEEDLTWDSAPAKGDAILTGDGTPASFTTLKIADNSATGDARLEGAAYYDLDISTYFNEVSADGQLSVILQSTGYTVFASKEFEEGQYAPQLVLSDEVFVDPSEEEYMDLEGGRSSLYPEDWYPGYSVEEGRFLHDFSYAGYKMGEAPIPDDIPGEFVDVTQAPYNADHTGAEDVTTIIQDAIDFVSEAGGGVVYLPAGTYKVKPQGINNEALKINSSGVVLRGAGPSNTFIFNDESYMREKNIITITSEGSQFLEVQGSFSYITNELLEPTTHIPVQDASGFQIGDWVNISNKYTNDLIAEHDMTGWWDIYEGNEGVTFYRKVVAVDTNTHTLTIDIPTRYPLKPRDFAGVYKVNAPVSDSGVEHLSIGNVENLTPGIAESDNTVEGTAGYEVAGTNAVQFVRAVDSWARNVHSYRPAVNSEGYDYHILSSGIVITNSRNVTVVDSDMRKPLFRGAGGNGYLFEIIGNDNLVKNANAEEGRHSYTFSHMRTSGNVILNSTSKDPTHVIDFHQYLSMANLIDGMTLDGDTIEANIRPYPSSSTTYKHGQTTSQTVIWNTTGNRSHFKHGDGTIIDSRQFGHGYVIGTQGDQTKVKVTPVEHAGRDTGPVDFAEGIGQGADLITPSLYVDQLQKRLDRQVVELKSITVNGKPIASFQFGKLEYDIELPFGTDANDVPVVSAAAFNDESTVTVVDAAYLPETTFINVASQGDVTTAQYKLNFTVAQTEAVLEQVVISPDSSKPGWKSGLKIDNGNEAWINVNGMMSNGTPADLEAAVILYSSDNEEVLTIDEYGRITTVDTGSANVVVSVTLGDITLTQFLSITSVTPVYSEFEIIPILDLSSSGDDGNIAENVNDYDYDTRWSASGDGQWIMADLGANKYVGSLRLAFFNGHLRQSIFDIEVSTDGINWTNVFEKDDAGNSNGETTLLEHFSFNEPQEARYIRVVGYGNTVNAWNSITEMHIHPAEPPRNDQDSSTPPAATISSPVLNEDGSIKVDVTPTLKSNPNSVVEAESEISEALFKELSDKAIAAGNGVKTIEIALKNIEGANAYSIKLPWTMVTSDVKEARITKISTAFGTIEAPGNMFNEKDAGVGQNISLSISTKTAAGLEGLDEQTKAAIADRPIVDLNAFVDGNKIAWSNQAAPVTVKIPYTPSEEELNNPKKLESITIWYLDEDGKVKPVPNAKYDKETGVVVFKTTHFSKYSIVLNEKTFEDIATYTWAQNEIEILASRGVINGISESAYVPAKNITRADFMKLIVNALGLSANIEINFMDVDPDAYYYNEVAVAKKLGIINGVGNDKFEPTAEVTRQDMMVMIMRAMRAAGKLEELDAADLNRFTDIAEVSAYAVDSIASLVDAGLIEGHEGKVRPLDHATRAEAAVLIYRILNK